MSAASDSAGARISQQEYDPWGKVLPVAGSAQTTQQSKHNYTGQRLDDTGLLFYNARYYDPQVGRFVSPDSIVPGASFGAGGAGGIVGLAQNHKLTVDFHEYSGAASLEGGDTSGPANPQALNRYAYVLNNPIRYVDPTGHGVDCGLGMPCSPAAGGRATATPPPTATPRATPGKTPAPVAKVPTAGPASDLPDVYVSQEWYDTMLNSMLNAPIGSRPVMSYKDAKRFTEGRKGDIQAHHILEQRHAKFWQWGKEAIDNIPSIVLTRGEHTTITNALQSALKIGVNYSKAEVWAVYQNVYKNYPHWLKAIEHYFK